MAQGLEARIDVVVGVVVRAAGQLLTANDAQARAVVPAERRDRLRQNDGISDLALEIQLMVVGQAELVRLGGVSTGRPLARSMLGRASSSRSISTGHVDLAQAAGCRSARWPS